MAVRRCWGGGRQCTGSCSARALYTHTSSPAHRPLTRPAPPSASQRRGVAPTTVSLTPLSRRSSLVVLHLDHSAPSADESSSSLTPAPPAGAADRGVCDGRDGSEEVVAPVMFLRRRPRQAPSSSPLGRALRRAPPLERRGRARRLRRRCCCPGRWPPLARAAPPPRGHAYASRLGRRIRKPSAHSV